MAEIDPLGEVYQGRDNTGSANIIGPRVHRSYADVFIDEIGKRQAKRAALQGAAQKMLDPGSFKAWEIDTPYMQGLRDTYTNAAIDYQQNIGRDKNADAVKYQTLLQLQDKMFHSAGTSDAERQKYDMYSKMILTDPDKFDGDAGKILEDWKRLPTEQRLGTEPALKSAKANWLQDYMKTAEIGPKPVGSEAPSSKYPGFTSVYKGDEFDETRSLDKAGKYLLGDNRNVRAVLAEAKQVIDNDPQMSQQYNSTNDPVAKKKMEFAVAQRMLVGVDRDRAKIGGAQSLQPIPEHVAGNKIDIGLDELLKNGGVVKDETFTVNDRSGKFPYTTKARYSSSYKSNGVTVVTANNKTWNLNEGKEFSDQRQFKFNPGSTKVLDIVHPDGTTSHETYVFGQAVDTKSVPSGSEITIDDAGNFQIGGKTVDKSQIMDVAVPLSKVENFLHEKPVSQSTRWAHEAEDLLSKNDENKKPESVPEITRDAEYKALPKGAQYKSNGNIYIKK